MMNALGMIEVYGYLTAVEALDSALKAANVKLLSVCKVTGGLVTVFVSGDVGAVKAAMDASVAAAERVGTVVSVHVIPRPAEGVAELLLDGNAQCLGVKPLPEQNTIFVGNSPQKADLETFGRNKVEQEKFNSLKVNSGEHDLVESTLNQVNPDEFHTDQLNSPKSIGSDLPQSNMQVMSDLVSPTQTSAVVGASSGVRASNRSLTRENMANMKVVKLRSIAYSLKLPNMSKKEIRYAKKEELIERICEFQDRRDE